MERKIDGAGPGLGLDRPIAVVEKAKVEGLIGGDVSDVERLEPQRAAVGVACPICCQAPLESCGTGWTIGGQGRRGVLERHFGAMTIGQVVVDDEKALGSLADGVFKRTRYREAQVAGKRLCIALGGKRA